MSSNLSSSLQKSNVALPERIIQADSTDFRKNFNRDSFQFSHNLAEHSLFQIPRLVELANYIYSKDPTKVPCFVAGEIPIEQKWSGRIPQNKFAEAIARIEESGSLVMIIDPHLDPEYKTLLDQIVIELEEATGEPLQQQITWLGSYVFITSPNSITHYHIDHESNFLFQIHGEKEVNLFDQQDRSVLTDPEIESFYIGDIEAANYQEENQIKASVYHLNPGQGVHHPVLAPHWIKTNKNFSVTLSVLFYMRPFDLRARVYQTNYLLRKLGLTPKPPEQSAFIDSLKINLVGLFADSNPTVKYEIVRSGINRLLSPLRLGTNVARKLTSLPRTLVRRLPVISDYYRYYWSFPREYTACRGVYQTFTQALQALPPDSPVSHNQTEIHENATALHLSSGRTLGRLEAIDQPLLPWLRQALTENPTILDFGGNIGVSYYAFKKHIPYPQNLNWIVCELPEMVKAGEKTAQQHDSQELLFTTDFTKANETNILLTSGTLQYVEAPLADMLATLYHKPKHLLVNHVPFYEGDTFYTLQNIGYAFCPYKIQNRIEFLKSLEVLGYELIDSWQWNRTCLIPFHSERSVRSYYGFYLKLKEVLSHV